VNDGREPFFSGGFVLKVQSDRAENAEMQALDLQGALSADVVLRIPGAKTVTVRSMARSVEGWFAIGGYFVAEDDPVGEFIYIADNDGKSSNIIRTDPFAPRTVAIAADGTIWAAGNVYGRKSAPSDADPAGGVLRHFDRTGRLLGSFFPESALDDRVRTAQGILSASQDRVGWISTGNFRQGVGLPGSYVEIARDGSQQTYPLPPIEQALGSRVLGLALTDDGSAFATGLGSDGTVKVFSLNREQRSWEQVMIPGLAETAPFLIGSGGNAVAFWGSADGRIRFYESGESK
jgi:hypothetical protein